MYVAILFTRSYVYEHALLIVIFIPILALLTHSNAAPAVALWQGLRKMTLQGQKVLKRIIDILCNL